MYAKKLYRQEGNQVLELFFSAKNIDALQNALVDLIYKSTGVTISRQSERDLLGIMHFMYNAHASAACSGSVVQEVRRLNKYVLEEYVDSVKSGMLMYIHYLKDASTLPTPIDRSVSTTDDKSLDMRNTFI